VLHLTIIIKVIAKITVINVYVSMYQKEIEVQEVNKDLEDLKE